MKGRRQPPAENQLTLYDEASLFARLSQQQGRLVSDLLAQAARTSDASRENVRLAADLAGSLDRLQEVHHRIRNHLQTVTGLLSAQQTAERSSGARRALQKSVARLTSIAAIHDLLARDPASGDLRLPELAQQLSRHLLSQAGAERRLRIHLQIKALTLPAKQATAFVLILTELLCNAIEHAFPRQASGDIHILLELEGDKALLQVKDSGCGLPRGFDFERGGSLGLRLVARLAERDLGGAASAHSDGGACFRVAFPVPGAPQRGAAD